MEFETGSFTSGIRLYAEKNEYGEMVIMANNSPILTIKKSGVISRFDLDEKALKMGFKSDSDKKVSVLY